MINKSLLIIFILLIAVVFNGCSTSNKNASEESSEITDGFVRLVLFENTGSFSLSYVPNTFNAVYEPLFTSRDPKSSYLTISVDGKIHRLGSSRAFSSKIDRLSGNPALVFKSENLTVTQVFTPVKTMNSKNANGIKITIIAENKGKSEILFGLRFLLDTQLGENKNKQSFLTNNFVVSSELKLESDSGEKYWLSKGELVSLMGSIVNPIDKNSVAPDYVHFANWKRLNEAPWKLRYFEGRSFTNLPYSVNDSAVCYFYEPSPLSAESSVTYTIFLTTEDTDWYFDKDEIIHSEQEEAGKIYIITNNENRTVRISALSEEEIIEAGNNNLIIEEISLIRIREIVNQFIEHKIHLEKQDLDELEKYINIYRN